MKLSKYFHKCANEIGDSVNYAFIENGGMRI